jgi:hypothetical protein
VISLSAPQRRRIEPYFPVSHGAEAEAVPRNAEIPEIREASTAVAYAASHGITPTQEIREAPLGDASNG